MILLSSKNFSMMKLHWISFALQGQMRQLKIGLQGLRSSERTSFLKKLFERFDNVQKWFRRIAGCAHLNSWTACLCRKWMWTCEQGLHLWKWYAGMNCMGGTVWTGSASVNEICTFELAILLRYLNQLTWCFTCKMFARLWMRHTPENEVCTCEPVNRVRSYLRNALLWMDCTCVHL